MTTPEDGKDTNVLRRTPEEIKKGLNQCCDLLDDGCGSCPFRNEDDIAAECITRLAHDSLAYIQQLETTYSQVSKSLCGKGNATPEEILQEFSQVKSRLAQAERERDAALKDIANTCWSCRNAKPSQLSKFLYSCTHLKGKAGVCTQCENWQWRGPCPENTKEDTDHAD